MWRRKKLVKVFSHYKFHRIFHWMDRLTGWDNKDLRGQTVQWKEVNWGLLVETAKLVLASHSLLGTTNTSFYRRDTSQKRHNYRTKNIFERHRTFTFLPNPFPVLSSKVIHHWRHQPLCISKQYPWSRCLNAESFTTTELYFAPNKSWSESPRLRHSNTNTWREDQVLPAAGRLEWPPRKVRFQTSERDASAGGRSDGAHRWRDRWEMAATCWWLHMVPIS